MSDAAGMLPSPVRPHVECPAWATMQYMTVRAPQPRPPCALAASKCSGSSTPTSSSRPTTGSTAVQAAPDGGCAAGEVSKAGEATKHSLSQTLPASIGCSAVRETEAPKLLDWGQLQLAQLQLCAGEQRTSKDCAPVLLRPRMLLDQRLNSLQPCLRGGRAKDGS